MDKAEAEAKAKAIAEAWAGKINTTLISAASQVGVKNLCWDVMTFIIENPVVQAEEAKQPEKVEFMWDDYHRQQLEELEVEEEKTGTTTGMKTTKKVSSSSTSTNRSLKPPEGGFLLRRTAASGWRLSRPQHHSPASACRSGAARYVAQCSAQAAATLALVKTTERFSNRLAVRFIYPRPLIDNADL